VRRPARPFLRRCPGVVIGQRYAPGRRCARTGSSARPVGPGTCPAQPPRSRTRAGPFGDHRPPWVDDHGVAVAAGIPGAGPDLPDPDHEGFVFHGPGPEQELPVGRAGGRGERRRHHQHGCSHEGHDPVDLREAEVVADRQAEHGRWEVPDGIGLQRDHHEVGSRAMVADSQKLVPSRSRRRGGSSGTRRGSSVRSEETAGVEQPSASNTAPVDRPGVGEAAGQEMDAVTPGHGRAPGRGRAVQWLGVAPQERGASRTEKYSGRMTNRAPDATASSTSSAAASRLSCRSDRRWSGRHPRACHRVGPPSGTMTDGRAGPSVR